MDFSEKMNLFNKLNCYVERGIRIFMLGNLHRPKRLCRWLWKTSVPIWLIMFTIKTGSSRKYAMTEW